MFAFIFSVSRITSTSLPSFYSHPILMTTQLTKETIALFKKLHDEWNGSELYDPYATEEVEVNDNSIMMVPSEFVGKSGDFKLLTNQHTLITYLLNLAHLMRNRMKVEDARIISYFRANFASTTDILRDPKNSEIALHCSYAEMKRVRNSRMDEYIGFVSTDASGNTKFSSWTKTPDIMNTSYIPVIVTDIANEDYILDETVQFAKMTNSASLHAGATFIPIVMHMNFVKSGHHYRPNSETTKFYRRQFASMVMSELLDQYNTFDICYNAFHWAGPMTLYTHAREMYVNNKMPRGLAVKFPLVPSGAATICSTVAVILSYKTSPAFAKVYEYVMDDYLKLKQFADNIRRNYIKYHIRSDLFGEVSLLDTDEFKEMHELAVTLAPMNQAYLDVYAKNSDLGQIMSLRKHANQYLGQFKVYEEVFKAFKSKLARELREKTMAEIVNTYMTDNEQKAIQAASTSAAAAKTSSTP